MNAKELETIKKSTAQVESALTTIEGILENTNNRALYQSTGSLVEVLRHLNEVDPHLLSPDYKSRIEALLLKEKASTGRDSFNTGF
jgi:hypothetical protein